MKNREIALLEEKLEGILNGINHVKRRNSIFSHAHDNPTLIEQIKQNPYRHWEIVTTAESLKSLYNQEPARKNSLAGIVNEIIKASKEKPEEAPRIEQQKPGKI